jgi:hypothetical protein
MTDVSDIRGKAQVLVHVVKDFLFARKAVVLLLCRRALVRRRPRIFHHGTQRRVCQSQIAGQRIVDTRGNPKALSVTLEQQDVLLCALADFEIVRKHDVLVAGRPLADCGLACVTERRVPNIMDRTGRHQYPH